MNKPNILYHISSIDHSIDNQLTISQENTHIHLTLHFRINDCNAPLPLQKEAPTLVTLSFARSYLDKMGLDCSVLHPVLNTRQTMCCHSQMLIQEMIQTKYQHPYKKVFIECKALEILLYVIHIRQEVATCDHCKFLQHPIEKEKIETAKAILLEQLATPPTIEALASQIGINQCYLKKGFKELFGTTIFEFVQEQRMKKAQFLMEGNSLSTIAEIAEKVGYANIENFSNAFKKRLGIRPSEYHKRKIQA